MRPRLLLLTLAAAVSAVVVWRWRMRGPGAETATAALVAGVPVTIAKVIRTDVPLYLTGVGRIQALNTVVLRTQVDGKIVAMPFREGAEVKAGDLLIQIDQQPYQALLDQAESKLDQDRAQAANAQAILKRDSELVKKGMLDTQDFETQQSAVAQVAALVKADEAAVAVSKLNLEYTHIVSPIAGQMGLRQVDPGNLVLASENTSLATIAQVEPIALVFALPERDFGRVSDALRDGRLRQKPTVFAVDRDNHTVLDAGELLAVDNQIDPTTGTFKLKAVFKNEGRKLWPGQFVNARLLVAIRRGALVAPPNAVEHGPDGDSAFVVGPDLKAKYRSVTLDQSEEGAGLISAGLDEGERVVVDGQLLLHPNDRVHIMGTISAAPPR